MGGAAGRVGGAGAERTLARFRMLFSGGRTATATLTCGIAEVGSEAPCPCTRRPEVCLGLGGTVRATVGGRKHMLSARVALFVPGHAEHAVHADAPARFFFAADSDPEIDCTYPKTG